MTPCFRFSRAQSSVTNLSKGSLKSVGKRRNQPPSSLYTFATCAATTWLMLTQISYKWLSITQSHHLWGAFVTESKWFRPIFMKSTKLSCPTIYKGQHLQESMAKYLSLILTTKVYWLKISVVLWIIIFPFLLVKIAARYGFFSLSKMRRETLVTKNSWRLLYISPKE